MEALLKSDVIGKKIVDVTYREQRVTNSGIVRDYFFVLDSNFLFQLLQFGLRFICEIPVNINKDRSRDTIRYLYKKITAVITDSHFYPPASADKSLSNPPYDDVYIILDNVLCIANRFFENMENAVVILEKQELLEFGYRYFDYWTQEEVQIESLFNIESKT